MMKKLPRKTAQLTVYAILLATAVMAMTGMRRCSTSSPLPPVRHGWSGGDTLDVAVTYGPMSFGLYADTLGGLNHDLLQRMAHDLGIQVRMWPVVSLHDALRDLREGRYDIFASLPASQDIKSRFATTRSVYLDRLVLVQLAGPDGKSAVTSSLQLGDDTIRIPKDSPAAARLVNLSHETGREIPFVECNDLSEEYLCIQVATGRIPLAVVNEKTARQMRATYPDLRFDSPVSFTQFQSWLLAPKDTALLHRVDLWLDSIQRTEWHSRLLERYN